MVEFALPKNSKITGGKTWPKPVGATETREFKVYRWNPDDGKNPGIVKVRLRQLTPARGELVPRARQLLTIPRPKAVPARLAPPVAQLLACFTGEVFHGMCRSLTVFIGRDQVVIG